jgi:ATP-dependent RNA helicase DDX23/PRP28
MSSRDGRKDRRRYSPDRRDRRDDRKQERPKDDEPPQKRFKQDDGPIVRPSNPYLLDDAHVAPPQSTTQKKQPRSLDELVKKKQEEDQAQLKPVFVSKKARGKRDLFGEDKIDDRRQKIEEMRREREKLLGQHQQNDVIDKAREQELQEIKDDYLNKKEPKKRVIKQSDKFKFAFDWSASDDTSTESSLRHEAPLLFGRGKRAGTDISEQNLKTKTNHDDVRDNHRKSRRDFQDLNRLGKPWQEKTLEEMDERDWRIFKEDFEISAKGGKIPNPLRNWHETGIIPPKLIEAINEAGYTEPTPIQRACIPIGVENRDIIGLAETGSGKTFAFVLPMLVYISKLPPLTGERIHDGPYALVLAPTRELALQIEDETRKFASKLGYRVHSVIGGVNYTTQNTLLRDGYEILIGTPGRLVDCLENHFVVLNQCNYVVLDEADRMIDMNFESQINAILDAMPSSNTRPEDESLEEENRVYRQTTMFSATMPPALEKIALKYLRRRIVISVGEVGKAVERIEQRVVFCKGENEKRRQLLSILEEADPLILIFVNQKRTVDEVAKAIKDMYRVTTVHGSKSQESRESSLAGFANHQFDVMVATDVLGRGIDIKDITLVINYDLPNKISTYTHRIGRTARAGRGGKAISFFMNEDSEIAYDLKQMLERTKNTIPMELQKHESATQKPNQLITQPLQRKNQVIYK